MPSWGQTLTFAVLATFPPGLEGMLRGGPWGLGYERGCERASAMCGRVERIDVEGLGIVLHGAEVQTRGTSMRSKSVVVRATWGGVQVDVHEPHFERIPVAPSPRAKAAAPPRPSDSVPQGPPTPMKLPWRGVPLTVALHDPLTLDTNGARVRVHHANLTVDTEGHPEVHIEADVRRGGLWASSVGPLRLHPLTGGSAWSLDGLVQIGEDAVFHTRAEWNPSRTTIDAQAPRGGRIQLERRSSQRWSVRAQGFPLAVLHEVWPGRPAGVDLKRATLSGGAEAVLDEDGLRLNVQRMTLDALALDDRRLAKVPIELSAVQLDGSATLHDRQDLEIVAELGYGPLAAHLSLTRNASRWAVDATLAELDCQSFFEGLPTALTAPLAGLEVEGRIGGRIELDVDLSALTETEDSPGRLNVDFPVLERCIVQKDPAILDDAGLKGPYRHHFIDGLGRPQTRTLAAGAPGYRPLGAVPLLAGAFVALEDARFWRHDGFDRDQIERALWHNLRAGRISRGASTISQQTARNLFLGIDRSLARKVQEAFLAARLEAHLSKARILEIYLNIIELGPGVHGVEDAAYFYFGRAADELHPLEALHLAAMAPAPHLYSERFAHGEVDATWLADLRHHARRMARHGTLPSQALQAALWRPIRLRDRLADEASSARPLRSRDRLADEASSARPLRPRDHLANESSSLADESSSLADE